MIITTRKQLLAAVPVHEHNGKPYFVRLSEIPEPWRTQMKKEVILCAQPAIGKRSTNPSLVCRD